MLYSPVELSPHRGQYREGGHCWFTRHDFPPMGSADALFPISCPKQKEPPPGLMPDARVYARGHICV